MYAKFCVNREAASNFMRLFVNRRAYAIQAERPCRTDPFPITRRGIGRPENQNRSMMAWCACTSMATSPSVCTRSIRRHNARSGSQLMPISMEPLESLFQLQWELKQDGVDAALEQSRRGGHLWIFGAEPLLASECRIYVYNLALRLGVPVKGGGLKEGIEVFPRQDRIEDGELGNAIRAPLGVHRKTNRRYWFYEAEPTPEAQLAYLDRLTKLTEAELRTFIEGMSLPEAYRPVVPASYTPPASSPSYPEFRILDYVRTTRKDGRNWWARCPSCAGAGRDRSGDNLAIQIQDPRFYKCWAGCTKEEIRAALGQSIRKARGRSGSKRMNASKKQKPESATSRHAVYGLALPASVLKALQKRGIYCTPGVSLEHQHLASRYVLRGVESGGAVSDMGRACAFVAPDGSPLTWLQSLHSIAVNGRHAIFLAESLVRLEMLRSVQTYELAITLHTVSHVPGRKRPRDCIEAAVSRTGWCAPIRSLEGGTPRTPGKIDSHLLRPRRRSAASTAAV